MIPAEDKELWIVWLRESHELLPSLFASTVGRDAGGTTSVIVFASEEDARRKEAQCAGGNTLAQAELISMDRFRAALRRSPCMLVSIGGETHDKAEFLAGENP